MREWLSGGAPPCQGGGRGFDPRLALFNLIFLCARGSAVEHLLAKEGVAGSISVLRSYYFKVLCRQDFFYFIPYLLFAMF